MYFVRRIACKVIKKEEQGRKKYEYVCMVFEQHREYRMFVEYGTKNTVTSIEVQVALEAEKSALVALKEGVEVMGRLRF